MLFYGGHDYTGEKHTTAGGQECDSWSDHTDVSFVKDINFSDGSVEKAGTKCRNPDVPFQGGVWCYVNGKREMCDVPECPGKENDDFMILRTF